MCSKKIATSPPQANPTSQAFSFETLNSIFLNGIFCFIIFNDSLTTAVSTQPPVTEPEKSLILKSSDIFAMTPITSGESVEGFGMAFIDAAFHGIAAIGSDDGGIKDAIIDGKTAGPFATACACAAIVAGASEDTINALEEFGWEVGRAFQLVDDLLDLIGDENMGKPRGGDVHEGKMTLPIIHALTMLHGVEREQLADVLKNFSDDRWNELVSLLSSAGSFEYSEQLIENHVNRALIQLDSLPQSIARDLMAEVAKKSRSRKK